MDRALVERTPCAVKVVVDILCQSEEQHRSLSNRGYRHVHSNRKEDFLASAQEPHCSETWCPVALWWLAPSTSRAALALFFLQVLIHSPYIKCATNPNPLGARCLEDFFLTFCSTCSYSITSFFCFLWDYLFFSWQTKKKFSF